MAKSHESQEIEVIRGRAREEGYREGKLDALVSEVKAHLEHNEAWMADSDKRLQRIEGALASLPCNGVLRDVRWNRRLVIGAYVALGSGFAGIVWMIVELVARCSQ